MNDWDIYTKKRLRHIKEKRKFTRNDILFENHLTYMYSFHFLFLYIILLSQHVCDVKVRNYCSMSLKR